MGAEVYELFVSVTAQDGTMAVVMPDQLERPLLSIVSPVYQAEGIVDEFVRRVYQTLDSIADSYEIILVDDGSPDEGWRQIVINCSQHYFVKGIRLSRNFGQHIALTAGLQAASGEFVVVMDCDLQENPKYIPELLAKAREGFDIVLTRKRTRQHSFFKNITARMFYWIFNHLTDGAENRSNLQSGTLSLLSRKAADAFCRINDCHRHYLMVVRLLGFRSDYIDVEHDKRLEGKSSYTFSKLARHAIDGITSQSVRLLHFSVAFGFVLSFLSGLWAAYLFVQYFVHGAVPGYTSIMMMLSLATGLILTSIGIVGTYIGKIFEQVKGRPLYFIDETVNLDEQRKSDSFDRSRLLFQKD
jgi:polyisoprenyl-phosphate glycosyltransferase